MKSSIIPTVNYHLLKACNMGCKFCYATFADIQSKRLTPKQDFALIEQIAESQLFRKINFAGGEPTLVPHLRELIYFAKSCGLETSVVTNGSRIDAEWLHSLSNVLDILTLSVDSLDDESNRASGRTVRGTTIARSQLLALAAAAKQAGTHLKINTVVSQFNHSETMTDFINTAQPFRWKILQVARVEGQNDQDYADLAVSSDQFHAFCQRNSRQLLPSIRLVPESNDIILGSYLMIDQLGRFYDTSTGQHRYSAPVLQVGIAEALRSVFVDWDKFMQRDGLYSVHKPHVA